jgi:hypothetical protein
MTLTQRVGFTILSLCFFAGGLFLLQAMMVEWRSSGNDALLSAVLFGMGDPGQGDPGTGRSRTREIREIQGDQGDPGQTK